MYNVDKQLKAETKKIYSQFNKECPNSIFPSLESKKKYMTDLIHVIAVSAVKKSTAFPNLIKKEQIDFYANNYVHCWFNYIQFARINESLGTVDKATFYCGWKYFIKELRNTHIDIGPQTTLLRDLTTMTVLTNSIGPKKERFWKYYVERKNPLTNEKKVINKQELPLYYILYTIYYYHTSCGINNEPFYSFGTLFKSYKKWTHINPILDWCILCFKEWYDLAKNKTKEYNFSSYIAGISTFLEHFGYYYHYGLLFQEDKLARLFNNYEYTNTAEDICFTFEGAKDFITTHRLHTQHRITDKPLYNKARKDERQQHMSAKTNYISDRLKEYFHLPKDKFWDYLEYNGSSEYLETSSSDISTVKTEEIEMPENVKFIELCAREIFASLFLALSRAENDLLAFVHTQLNFDCIINLLDIKHFLKSPKNTATVTEEYASQTDELYQKAQEICLNAPWYIIDAICKLFAVTSSQVIYQCYLEDYFKETKRMFPITENEWLDYINDRYISSLVRV